MYIYIGIIAFLLFFINDLEAVTIRKLPANLLFFPASLLLAGATLGMIFSYRTDSNGLCGVIIGGIVFLASLMLLIHTLFFAIPAGEAYMNNEQDPARKVCRIGVYALCRHPGVLWLFFMYMGLWIALPSRETLLGWLLYFVLDLLYVVLQDRVIFPILFTDYAEYCRSTPFLIPNTASIKLAIGTRRKDC